MNPQIHHEDAEARRRHEELGDPVIGRSGDLTNLYIGVPVHRCIGRRRLGRILFFLLLQLVVSFSGVAQTANLSVRLYSLHSEHHVKLIARNGSLAWKTCESCPENKTQELIIESTENALKIQGTEVADKELLVSGDYRVVPESGLSFAAAFPMRIRAEHGLLNVLATVPLEDYVAAAVAGESGSFENQESLKAMAVAVRTYALHFRSRHRDQGFDLCDSTHCQALNFKGISAQARAASVATRGEILWYEGSPAATFYHQNCGGTTAAAAEVWLDLQSPYLKQHADPYCVRETPLPWRAEIRRSQLENALRQQNLTFPKNWERLEVISRTPSGRVQKLGFRSGSQPPQLISASSLRFAIGRSLGWNQVRSEVYEIETTADSVIFKGRGAGHGVGLCQAGAEQMAREGKAYREILAFYYPGTELGTAARGFAWQRRETERFIFLSTQPDQDVEVLQRAEAVLPAQESELGWKLNFKLQLKVYPTLDAFRDATGQPGWIAGFTRGHTISLQPLAVLKQKSALDSTLRHEFTHLLVESRAHAATPLWFREGLVLYLAETGRNVEPVQMKEAEIEAALEHPEDRQSLERAYAAARTRVAQMVQQNGRETVLQRLSSGLPRQ